MVDIKDFAYVPDPVEIPVGATVTWTNSDTAPHTATAKDREALQSGTLNPGDSYSQAFDQPGTIDYFCEFHANMKGHDHRSVDRVESACAHAAVSLGSIVAMKTAATTLSRMMAGTHRRTPSRATP